MERIDGRTIYRDPDTMDVLYVWEDGTLTSPTGGIWQIPTEPATLTDVQAVVEAAPLTVEQRLARLEAIVLGTPDTPGVVPEPDEAPPFVQPTGAHDAIPPNALRSFPDGTVRRNISGQWLAHGPDTYPRGWATESGAPATPEAWDPEATYHPPATVTHRGEVWDLVHDHALPGWEPGAPGMHEVWKARTP